MAGSLATQREELPNQKARQMEEDIFLTAGGDREAFARLYRAAASPVYAYALSMLKNRQDAEDALHDCFVKVYQAAGSYDSRSKPMAWIMTIARNLCLRTLQLRCYTADIPDEDWESCLRQREGLGSEERLIVQTCMHCLKEQERQILLLHAVAGFKHREIAAFLNMPLATVLSKYSRAAKKLKSVLEGESVI